MNIKDLVLSHLNKLDKKVKIILVFVFATLVLVIGYWLLVILFSPPADFPINKVITIEKGDTLNEISRNFKNENLIRSSVVFETLAWIFNKEKQVKAGEYFFEKPLMVMKLLKEITGTGGETEFVRVTIPEGATIQDIINIFRRFGFENFDIEDKSLEGQLFPDTYFVPLRLSSDDIVKIMLDNFEKKTILEMRTNEILTMASLLEKEAAKTEDRKLISGILWKRLDAGMLLQVDAVFPYIMNKNTFQLTLDDLKVDSPYNTYLYKGLPLGPIANPGFDSLEAALNPIESKHWYYLSDKESNVHYSATYEQHLIKKEKYLK